MAVFHFSGEIINELDSSFLEFEFEYEESDPLYTREELVQMGKDFASFRNPEMLQYVLDNLSIVLNFEGVETDND